MRKSLILFVAVIFGFGQSIAQLNKDIFPLKSEFKKGGLYVFPHATYSIGNKTDGKTSRLDTLYAYDVQGSGKWAYGLEVGWFHSFEKPRLIHYVEGGLAYRLFKGTADHSGTLTTPAAATTFQSDNTFDAQLAVASVRIVHVKQLKKYSYFSAALGANYNYRIGESYKRGSTYPLDNEKFIAESMAQLHVQIGVGFLESEKFLFVPTLESPILTAYPTDDLNPAFSFFNAKYHPIMIGLKVIFLRKDPLKCNTPTYNGTIKGM